jgi:uncharacterized protein GlcG (DUF336 family)
MNKKLSRILVGTTLLMSATATMAAPTPLPGDHGRPLEGIFPVATAPAPGNSQPQAPREPRVAAPAPPIALALKAALAIAEACKQYPLGIAVTDSEGVATLIYVPDGNQAWHGYSAVRKAYTAVTFATNTSQLVKKAQEDPAFTAQIKADPNLQAFSGGLVLKSGGKVVGAIGVSGAEPGGHDEECGLVGLNLIKDELM